MAKRNLIASTSNAAKEDIDLKIGDLNLLVLSYFSRFSKTNSGTKSIGESGMDFAEKCAAKVPVFPEILSGTFEKDDFLEKAAALSDYANFKASIVAMLEGMDNSVKGIKTDVMAYANEYYGILQREADRKAKYKPAFDELKGFYKKSKSEKSADNGKNKDDNGTKPAPSA